jgi:hypothetical protein
MTAEMFVYGALLSATLLNPVLGLDPRMAAAGIVLERVAARRRKGNR